MNPSHDHPAATSHAADAAGSRAGSSAGLARSAGVIGAATMASRILGLIREQVLAFLFGAGNEMDAFNVAFRIPNLFRDLFAEGGMSAAFVPTFSRRLARAGRAEAWRLGNLVINALLLVTAALVLAGVAFAHPIVVLFASDYASVPGKLGLTVLLTRVLFPFLPLVAVAAACMGMLNALHRFFVPALAPVMFNVATIACAVALVPLAPLVGLPPVSAIAIGALVGGLGQIAVQWPALRREGFRYRPIFRFRDPALREVLVLMGPGLVGLAAVQINLFINTVVATGEGTGAVSWLNYAFRLMYMPIGLFGVSVATAALPTLSRQASDGNLREMRGTVSLGLRMMFMLNVPATAGLIALAWPIVALIFQHGSFTAADTANTAVALAAYAPGLAGYSTVRFAVPAFYALGDSRTPVAVSMATVALNIVLNVILVRIFGYTGLAIGTASASLFNAGCLLWLLRRRLGGLDERRLLTALAKIATASLIMGLAVARMDVLLASLMPGDGVLERASRVFADITFALALLALVARLLRIEEFTRAMSALRRRSLEADGHP